MSNRDKCTWDPSQNIEWLGFVCDLVNSVLVIPTRKLMDLTCLVNSVLSNLELKLKLVGIVFL